MVTPSRATRRVALICLLVPAMLLSYAQGPTASGFAAPLANLGSGFTYQGHLASDGEPITDDCRMAFRLYDDATAGSQVSIAITTTVPVTAGLFLANLNFGAQVFNGDARWLGVRVRCSTDATFTDMGRQRLTATPYALYAQTAGALRGYPVAETPPVAGQVLTWDGTAWTPAVAASGDAWSLTGNAGTVAGTHILGTTDGVSLTLAVSGTAALRLEPNATSPNLIGGHAANSVAPDAAGATISGGGSMLSPNQVTADGGTVGGGRRNTASGEWSVVGGGLSNLADGLEATIGGGVGNRAGNTGTVSGGNNNSATGTDSSVGGGYMNNAGGYAATVPGGTNNFASGDYSYAAGGVRTRSTRARSCGPTVSAARPPRQPPIPSASKPGAASGSAHLDRPRSQQAAS